MAPRTARCRAGSSLVDQKLVTRLHGSIQRPFKRISAWPGEGEPVSVWRNCISSPEARGALLAT